MYQKIIKLLLFVLGIAVYASALDTIEFENGDILTGKILKQDAEHVHFRSQAFGTVTLNPRDIALIRSDGMPDHETDFPTEEPEGLGESQIPPKASSAKRSQTRTESEWSGQTGMAIAMRQSNTLRREGTQLTEKEEEFESYRFYGNVKWEGENNNLRWDWTYRYSRTDLRKNDDYYNIVQNYQHEFTPKYFASGKSLYQRDFRRGIEHEFLQTAEVGIKWIDNKKIKLTTSAGGGYHKYNRSENDFSDSTAKFIMDESLRWQLIHSLTLFQNYTHLGNLENYHLLFTSGLENKLIHDIFLRLEYRLDRDTEVNYDDKSYYDRSLLTSLLYKF
jgi:putative salt-induced outer membrane protein YdiY